MQIAIQQARRKAAAKRAEKNKKTGARLAIQRLNRGVKSSYVAMVMGIAPQTLSSLENGKRHWNDNLERKFLEAIGETKQKGKK